jgi:Domain of unknown function (DUF4932)
VSVRWLLVVAFACSSKKAEPPPAKLPPPRDAALVDRAPVAALELAVDVRIQAMSILMRLAGAPEYQVARTKFAAAVDRAFARFANHDAVQRLKALRASNGIAFDAPITLAVHLDLDFKLDNAGEVAALDKRWAGVDLEALAASIRAFVSASKLNDFVNAQDFSAEIQALRALDNPVPFFTALFGTRGDHVLVAGLLLGTNNVGVRNGTTYYQVLSTPTQALLVHEMAHSYINPLFATHAAQLEAAGTSIYPLFALTMRAQHYGDWQTMLNEAAVRALVVLYMRQVKGDVAGAAAALEELRAGFVWTNELTEVFRKYQRDGAPDAEAALPKVVALFDALAEQYAGVPPKTPFLGPFDAVLRGDFVLALPKGPAGDYARTLPPFANRPVVDDKATVPPGTSIVAYGSPASNAMIADIAVTAGWKITPDGIELGAKKFAGTHLVLIATWFRRDDPTRGIAVYTAADDADLVGVNHGVKHGPKDWLVARKAGPGWEVVETGDWPFENNAWVPPREANR